jgi:hypothetical protein
MLLAGLRSKSGMNRIMAAMFCALLSASAPAAADDEAAVRELEAQCQAERQRRLAAVRSELIAECKANRRNDPAFCERFYRHYGDGGPGVAPMFIDLPECVTAFAARDALRRRERG